jgi:4'-phosphopantetheinyl transferase
MGVDGAVRVWRARHADVSPQWTTLLDAPETDRLAALRRAPDRARFLTGCALVRTAIGRHLGIAPRDVPLDRRCPDCARPHGQVRVPGAYVSVSHAGDWVLVALSGDAAVGVDIELVTDRGDTAALANRVLAPTERAALESLPVPRRAAGFVRYWSRKEAVLKATGDGLRCDPARLRVTEPWAPAALLGWDDRPELVGRIHLQDIPIDARHEACVAYAAATVRQVEVSSAAELLRPGELASIGDPVAGTSGSGNSG